MRSARRRSLNSLTHSLLLGSTQLRTEGYFKPRYYFYILHLLSIFMFEYIAYLAVANVRASRFLSCLRSLSPSALAVFLHFSLGQRA